MRLFSHNSSQSGSLMTASNENNSKAEFYRPREGKLSSVSLERNRHFVELEPQHSLKKFLASRLENAGSPCPGWADGLWRRKRRGRWGAAPRQTAPLQRPRSRRRPGSTVNLPETHEKRKRCTRCFHRLHVWPRDRKRYFLIASITREPHKANSQGQDWPLLHKELNVYHQNCEE